MANGKFGGGNGSAASPFLVEDKYDIEAIRPSVTTRLVFSQTKNIDMSGVSHVPFGSNYSGTVGRAMFRYYGNGFSISNLNLSDSGYYFASFFGATGSSFEAHNIRFINCNMSSVGDCGVVASNVSNSTFSNISATGNVSNNSTSGRSGGLFGYSFGFNKLTNCSFVGDVTGFDRVGGILGSGSLVASNIFSRGSVSGSGSYAGGILGRTDDHDANITNCYSTSLIRASAYAGGIIGSANIISTLNNCYALNPRITRNAGSVSSNFGDIHGGGLTNLSISNCQAINTMDFVSL